MKTAALFLLAFSLTSTSLRAQADGWVNLFNGKDLDGWEQHGGKAKYRAENNEIVGATVPNTPNSFLCTKKHYGDFVLELDFKVQDGLNSGVQIRSEVFDKPTTAEI